MQENSFFLKSLVTQCIHPENLEKVINEVRYSIENNLDYFKHTPYRTLQKMDK